MSEKATPDIIGAVQDHMQTPLSQWSDRLNAGLGTYEIGSTEFRAYTDVPNDPTDEVVIVGGEYGNSYWAQHDGSKPNPALVRAHVIRDAIDPYATLVYMAGDAVGEHNLNLTSRELDVVLQGSMSPLADRWKAILEKLPNAHELRRGTGFGMSLGATVLSDVMRHNTTVLTSAGFVEAPNVVQRKARTLGKAFMSSGAHLADNIRFNMLGLEESEVAAEHLKSIDPTTARGIRGMGVFAAGIVMVSNRAVLAPMLRPTLAPAIEASLSKGHNVVHAWGTQADVSPVAENRAIRDQFESNPQYVPVELDGPEYDHSLTNIYAFMGYLARRAAR